MFIALKDLRAGYPYSELHRPIEVILDEAEKALLAEGVQLGDGGSGT